MRKFRTLRDDPSGRWKAGEVGEALPNSLPGKYAYMLDLGEPPPLPAGLPRDVSPLLIDILKSRRVYYFQADEVEPCP